MQYITYAASLHRLCIILLLHDITNIKKSHMKFFIACVTPVGRKKKKDPLKTLLEVDQNLWQNQNHYVLK